MLFMSSVKKSKLRDVTCHKGSHSVTFHPKQVNTPHVSLMRYEV